MKIVISLILFAGIILFFPLHIGNSSCLFGYWAGIFFHHSTSSTMPCTRQMLDHYIRRFALIWWASIGLTIYFIYHWQKKKNGANAKS